MYNPLQQEKLKAVAEKKGDKRSDSPGKRSKSPKKRGKKADTERPPSPKKDTKLKRRGEVDDTFKTIGWCYLMLNFVADVIATIIIYELFEDRIF